MRKKTMGLTIATILIAYISALTLSNQAFAQTGAGGHGGWLVGHSGLLGQAKGLGQEITQGIKAQLGKVGHSLGDVCLSCWGG
jgi:hypothetical protein